MIRWKKMETVWWIGWLDAVVAGMVDDVVNETANWTVEGRVGSMVDVYRR
jgi:hypothetical protein